jgi:multidrug resistance efflux pump
MIRKLTSALLLLSLAAPVAAGPLLTGIVEDVNAQTIEMPSLPGSWQRRIEWMSREGSEVAVGDVVVRLDPGDLIAREEQARTDLEKRRLSAERRVDELELEVMDAQRSVAEAESAVKLAEMDAAVPKSAIPKLDFERYRLAFENARQALIRAEAELLNTRDELQDVKAESRLEVQQAESNYQRIRDALGATEIRAEKSGFIIYGDNPYSGKKIFPGETLYTGAEIAAIASRDDLQIRFWIHEADIREISPGQSITVIADAQGAEPFSAIVGWASSQAVEKQDWSDSGYFQALAIPSAGVPDLIMPGMSVMGLPSRQESD